MRWSPFVLAVLVSACASSPLPEPDPSDPASQDDVIFRVIDGDTFSVSEGQLTIRVLGIDTPETKAPGKPVQCGGVAATHFAERVLRAGTAVRVRTEPSATGKTTDVFGRTLAYLEYDVEGEWKDYSVEAARAGMAYVYEKGPSIRRESLIRAAADEARQSNRGVWGMCPPK